MPTTVIARPKTLQERLQYLEQEARRILARPEAFTPQDRSSRDMLATTVAGPPAGKVEEVRNGRA